jgi:hypothetical protein
MKTISRLPVILSVAKNPVFMVISEQKAGFFATLRMTNMEIFGINI